MSELILADDELELLRGIAAGVPEKQIGRLLGISRYAVTKRAQRLKLRMGAKSRPHMVTLGYELGILGGDELREAKATIEGLASENADLLWVIFEADNAEARQVAP